MSVALPGSCPAPRSHLSSSRRAFLGLAGALGAVGLSACATSGAPAALVTLTHYSTKPYAAAVAASQQHYEP